MTGGSIIGTALVYLLPLLLLVGLFVMFSRMQGGGGRMGFGFGKSRAKQLSKDMPKTTFADVAGVDEAVEELYEIKDFLQNPSRYQALAPRSPRACCSTASPAPARPCWPVPWRARPGVPFFSISGSDFVEMFVGVGASRVRDLFEQAKAERPVRSCSWTRSTRSAGTAWRGPGRRPRRARADPEPAAGGDGRLR